MSVRTGDRTEGKLQVLNKVRELKKYSLDRVKTFPKSTRWLYAAPIAEEIRVAAICIRHANAVYISKEYTADYKYRHGEQIKAHSSLDALLDLIDDAYDAGYISGDQVNYWTGLILQTDDLLKAWIKSDFEKKKMIAFYENMEVNYNAKHGLLETPCKSGGGSNETKI